MGVLLGLLLHIIGGFAAGSFYIPFKLIKTWSWETSWLVLGFSAWVCTPIIMAWATVPHLFEVLEAASSETKLYTFIFGMIWGAGGLTFGLTMRYLGIGLGMAVALGFTAAFGSLAPPFYNGTFSEITETRGGILVLAGVFTCLIGIALAGKAGVSKEKDLKTEQQKDAPLEFDLFKGMLIAVISGILSASFAFGLEAGKPIAEEALNFGVRDVFKNNPVMVWILWGGFLTNFLWITILSIRNKTFSDFTAKNITNKPKNYMLAIAGGITWYLQFFFYGMGTTFLGEEYEFAGWSLHIAFNIIFSSLWGIYFQEWRGASKKTRQTLWLGLAVIIFSTILIGIGNNI